MALRDTAVWYGWRLVGLTANTLNSVDHAASFSLSFQRLPLSRCRYTPHNPFAKFVRSFCYIQPFTLNCKKGTFYSPATFGPAFACPPLSTAPGHSAGNAAMLCSSNAHMLPAHRNVSLLPASKSLSERHPLLPLQMLEICHYRKATQQVLPCIPLR